MAATRRDRSEAFGRAVADSLFADMQNPTCRGPNFTWAAFPQMAERRASAGAPMARLDSAAAGEAARVRANVLAQDLIAQA